MSWARARVWPSPRADVRVASARAHLVVLPAWAHVASSFLVGVLPPSPVGVGVVSARPHVVVAPPRTYVRLLPPWRAHVGVLPAWARGLRRV